MPTPAASLERFFGFLNIGLTQALYYENPITIE